MKNSIQKLCESLEMRTLLSAEMSSVVPNMLVVNGTDANDVIGLRYRGSTVQVTVNNTTQRFATSDINRIEIYAGEGHDIVGFSGLAIPTYVNAGAGNDSVVGGSGNDSLTGASGKDTLRGGAGDDRINGANSPDILYGDDGNDVIYCGVGDDYAEGGNGVDRFYGEEGDDRLIGNAQNDRIYGGDGRDRLWGLQGNDLLVGDSGNDRIMGGDGNDVIYGNSGVDLIYGEAGQDQIFARDGSADLIDGGDDADSAEVDDTEYAIANVETVDDPDVTTPTPPLPTPPSPTPVDTSHPVALSFNDEAMLDANFSTAVAEAKKLGVSAVRVWISLDSWDERPTAWNPPTLRQLANAWAPTKFETRASIAGLAMKRAYELKRQGFTILVTVAQYAGTTPTSVDQVSAMFRYLMNTTETPTSTQKFKDVVDMWEIGNEVDASHGWQPSGANKSTGLKSYVDQLLIPAAQELKSQKETVISGSVRFSSNDLKIILEQVKTRGALSYIDYAGFHPYGNYDPTALDDPAKSSLTYYTTRAKAISDSYGKKMIATEWNVRGYSPTGSQNAAWAAAVDEVYRNHIVPNYETAFYFALVDNYASRGGNPSARPGSALKHNYAGTITTTSPVDDLLAYYQSPLVKNDPFYSVLDSWK